jgi:hypothetical protein
LHLTGASGTFGEKNSLEKGPRRESSHLVITLVSARWIALLVSVMQHVNLFLVQLPTTAFEQTKTDERRRITPRHVPFGGAGDNCKKVDRVGM